MKAAISSTGPELQSSIDPRFGRCAYIIFYDTDTGDWEAVQNANREASGGAGIRTAQSVIDRGATAVVTGNIGPNAMQVLETQVKVYTGFGGTVEEAIQALKEGGLASSSSPTVQEHAGMAGGTGATPNPMSPGGLGPATGYPDTFRGGRGRGRGGGRGGGGGGGGMGRW
jgi:predicted Fe-Mo cluster-binding NifX family protein